MKRTIHLLPQTKQDWIHVWYSGSVALVVAMILKEAPISDRSGGRLGFHWSYDFFLFVAVFSLFVASSRVRSRVLAFVGCGVAIAGLGYLGRPVY